MTAAGKVRDHVYENPGIHFNAIVEQLDVTPPKLQRIASEEEESDDLVVESFYGKTHFYPPEFDEWERRGIALARRETSRDILLYLLRNGDSNPGTIADDLGIARSTVEWHVDRLIDAGLITKRREGRKTALSVSDPDRLKSILQTVEPGRADRWLDRTTRLFDHVFENGSSG